MMMKPDRNFFISTRKTDNVAPAIPYVHQKDAKIRDDYLKGIVHPKKENSVINYSPSCRSKPIRPLVKPLMSHGLFYRGSY